MPMGFHIEIDRALSDPRLLQLRLPLYNLVQLSAPYSDRIANLSLTYRTSLKLH